MNKIMCPFCNKPSFISSSEANQYFCFSCGMGGDRISYLHSKTHVSYKDAANTIKANLLPEESREEERRQVMKALSVAESFYFEKASSAKTSYFKKRGFKKEIIEKFRLGYAEGGKKLYYYLLKNGISENVMKKAGLLCVSEDGEKYEKFWKRIMFPIRDRNGNTIGFGGRVLGDEKPKYLNSSESIVFDKSHNLYALDFAKKSNDDFFFLCEGYVDVISLHQNGFTNAVASLGTAFTQGQAELLKKYKNSVYLVYDSDGPGQKATEKAISILLKEGLSVKVVSVAPYKDVDEMLKAVGPETFRKRVDSSIDGKRFLIKGKQPGEIARFLIAEI